MSVRVPANSRLRLTELISFNGVEFWDTIVLQPVPESDGDTQYTVMAGDRIDLIAYRIYGDPALWYYIAAANDLELLPVDLNQGQVLRIPPASYLSTYIGLVRVL